MEEAIELAIKKGGYSAKVSYYPDDSERSYEQALLDPLFWQALGKALGLEKYSSFTCLWCGRAYNATEGEKLPWWKNIAHKYFELKLTGGDEAEFWKELLN